MRGGEGRGGAGRGGLANLCSPIVWLGFYSRGCTQYRHPFHRKGRTIDPSNPSCKRFCRTKKVWHVIPPLRVPLPAPPFPPPTRTPTLTATLLCFRVFLLACLPAFLLAGLPFFLLAYFACLSACVLARFLASLLPSTPFWRRRTNRKKGRACYRSPNDTAGPRTATATYALPPSLQLLVSQSRQAICTPSPPRERTQPISPSPRAALGGRGGRGRPGWGVRFRPPFALLNARRLLRRITGGGGDLGLRGRSTRKRWDTGERREGTGRRCRRQGLRVFDDGG